MTELILEYCSINGLNLAQANVHSLYRLSLLSVEYRIAKLARYRPTVMSMPELPLTPMGQSFDILEYGTSLPGPLANLIMQIGTFDFEGVEYCPFIVGFGGVHPLYTTFSNL